jgi:ABC-type multidrug transport system permease subunit
MNLDSMFLPDSLRMFMSTLSAILGAVILISIILPWFLIAIVCVFAGYTYAAIFYRASARELKVRNVRLRFSMRCTHGRVIFQRLGKQIPGDVIRPT